MNPLSCCEVQTWAQNHPIWWGVLFGVTWSITTIGFRRFYEWRRTTSPQPPGSK